MEQTIIRKLIARELAMKTGPVTISPPVGARWVRSSDRVSNDQSQLRAAGSPSNCATRFAREVYVYGN